MTQTEFQITPTNPNSAAQAVSFDVASATINNIGSNCWVTLDGNYVAVPNHITVLSFPSVRRTTNFALTPVAPPGGISQPNPTGVCSIKLSDQIQPDNPGVVSSQVYTIQQQQVLAGPLQNATITNVPIPAWVQGLRIVNLTSVPVTLTVTGGVSGEILVPSSPANLGANSTIDCSIASATDTFVIVGMGIAAGAMANVNGLPFSPSFFVENTFGSPLPTGVYSTAFGEEPWGAMSNGPDALNAGQVSLDLLRASDNAALASETTYQQSAGNTGAGVLATDRLVDAWIAFDNPGLGAQATVTQAAPGAGLQLCITGFRFDLVSNAAGGAHTISIKDGTPTTLFSGLISTVAVVGTADHVFDTECRLVCAPNKGVTISFDAAVANEYESVWMRGIIIQNPQQ